MNCVNLVGRLTAKPELRYTNNNIAYTRITIAVDGIPTKEGEKTADFINVVVWKKQAETLCKYLDKGSMTGIEGRLHSNNYTDQDGNKRYSMDVQANRVIFLSKKENATQPNTQTSQQTNINNAIESDPFADFGDTVTLDDNFLD